ncbi:hypothetical protein Drose_28275 [Dactylosporangium roseum]|uniref:Uncharacterized protein n=1 Tax=Dactylosporangium roseum TaxID=47989 RepID=A0ABY5YZ57_9ACTN|nr:hypothetical protein [Dactylosporangium roseum]UWZ35035.1 hypothetical protein Drose_28275 [Dactylosporangium roseum]
MQQEQRTDVPEPRTADHDDVAVGTARVSTGQPGSGERGDERYPDGAGTARAEETADRRWEAGHPDDTAADDTAADDTGADDTAADGYDETLAVSDPAGAAAQPVDGEPEELLPGAVEVPPIGALWADGAVDGLRERWRELQLRFIDDPRSVAGEADALVAEAVGSVTAALESQCRRLAEWQRQDGDDTERLRAAVRQYRDFLDRLLGM